MKRDLCIRSAGRKTEGEIKDEMKGWSARGCGVSKPKLKRM